MRIHIIAEQVNKLAPDAGSIKAGTKLANIHHWRNTGQNEEATWGECQGSALYQVRISNDTLTTSCSCPSKKFPCKHALGLLYILATNAQSISDSSEPPPWVTQWLEKRDTSRQRKEATMAAKADAPPSASSAKSVAKREQKVQHGIEQLDLWLNDLIRNGLGSLATRPTALWEQRAAQLVDAQAPGLASRVRSLNSLPYTSDDWMAQLLGKLGRIALLTEAYTHPERYDEAMRDEVRQLIGWSNKETEIIQRGEHIEDIWLMLGQVVDAGENSYTQRTWLYGSNSKRVAYILQFAQFKPSFPTVYPLGVQMQAELAFWPGRQAQRALIVKQQHQQPLEDIPAGEQTLDSFLHTVASQLGRQPWQERFLGIIYNCISRYDSEQKTWFLQDSTDSVLPLRADEKNWELLAFSGGHPVTMIVEWNGEQLQPLGLLSEQVYHLL